MAAAAQESRDPMRNVDGASCVMKDTEVPKQRRIRKCLNREGYGSAETLTLNGASCVMKDTEAIEKFYNSSRSYRIPKQSQVPMLNVDGAGGPRLPSTCKASWVINT